MAGRCEDKGARILASIPRGFADVRSGQQLLPGCEGDYSWQQRLGRIQENITSIKRYFSLFPPDLANLIERFRAGAIPILRTYRDLEPDRRKVFLELIVSTPAIGYILSHLKELAPESTEKADDSLHQLLDNPQKDILQKVGFSESGKGLIKTLRRIPSQELSVPLLICFRGLWEKEKAREILRQTKRITYSLLKLLSIPFFQEHPRLLRDLTFAKLEKKALHLLRHISRRLKERNFDSLLSSQNPKKFINSCHAILYQSCILFGISASPPIPEIKSIQYLPSLQDIWLEAKVMRNCLWTVQNQDYKEAYYRVLTPQRATIELHEIDEKWFLVQCRLARNQIPSSDTIFEILTWLAAGQGLDEGLICWLNRTGMTLGEYRRK